MMAKDDFDLRELLGDDPEAEGKMPSIEDTPASELSTLKVIDESKIDARVAASQKPGYRESGHKVEPLALPIPLVPMDEEYPLTPLGLTPKITDEDLRPIHEKKHGSPDVIVENELDLDQEYRATFTATVAEIKDLEPEELQQLRHRLTRMVRRAKIQQRAIRVTEEGKLQFIEEKRRRIIKDRDTEFMSRRKPAEVDAVTGKPKVSRKSSDTGLSQAEKQIKQFCKLMMSDDVIAATLTSLGTPVPSNLKELTAKYRK